MGIRTLKFQGRQERIVYLLCNGPSLKNDMETIKKLKGTSTRYTVRFGSHGGFAYHDRLLHPSTGYSVSRQDCHFSVSTSLHEAVWEY